ncbi:MAG: NAD(P)-dependent oxidoreductase [Culicoidibacterales bacterium]
MKKIGFIGIGIMGGPIVTHLLTAGFTVFGFSRTREKVLTQIEQGMIWCDSIAKVASQSDIIFTMVGFPAEVEAIYFAKEGIFNHAKAGSYLVDLTTSQPALAIQIGKTASTLQLFALDAPVTGGDLGAINGSLSMMVGGSKASYELLLPILSHFATTIRYFGKSGNGQHAKMANQTAISANLLGLAESLRYAEHASLDLELLLEIMAAGSASSWQLVNNGPKVIRGDFEPGFFIKHFSKDLKIAIAEMKSRGVSLEALQLSDKIYDDLIVAGKADLGTQAVVLADIV